MTLRPYLPFEARHPLPAELATFVTESLAQLAEGGLTLTFESLDELHARQTAWPKGAKLSEAELRAEILAIFESLEAHAKRARRLFAQLPKAPLDEYEDEVPRGIYFVLFDALAMIFDGGLAESTEYLGAALAATPESLRASWVQERLAGLLAPLGDPHGERLRERVSEMLETAEQRRQGAGAPSAPDPPGEE